MRQNFAATFLSEPDSDVSTYWASSATLRSKRVGPKPEN